MYQFTMILMLFGLVFTVLMLLSPTRKLIFTMLSLITWFVLAALVTHVAIPYQLVVENAVVTGIHYTDSAAHLSVLFLSLGLFSFTWAAILIAETLTHKKLVSEEKEEE